MIRPFFLLLLLGNIADLATAFSSASNGSNGPSSSGLEDSSSDQPEVAERPFIEITNLGNKESLPSSFIQRWPNWFVETDGSLSRIPDQETGTGFVTPTSVEQLFQPIDLKRPQMKLALGLHVRSGQIRHVMPSLDVSYNGLHRNRGLCSVPLAYKWVDFGYLNSLADFSSYEFRVSSKKHVHSEEKDPQEWNRIFSLSGAAINKALEKAILCLAESDSDDLGSGSHIVHVALDDSDVTEIPKTKNILQATLVEVGGPGEPDLDIGILEVAVVATMSGSESEYLPEVYKPLFSDESLRNPLYAKFKKRKEDRAKEESKTEL